MKLNSIILAWVLFLPVLASHAQSPGILGREAPSFDVSQWMNLPQGKNGLDVTDLRGKVVYLYGFQSWCPGCHKYGFPTLQKIIERYGDDPEVAIVAVQTTFEGYSFNTFEKAGEIAEQYNLSIPIGQSGSSQAPSRFMANYRTGGTPWTILVDKKGIVRFNDFHIGPQDAFVQIEQMKKISLKKGSMD